jgi:hypothetical protein
VFSVSRPGFYIKVCKMSSSYFSSHARTFTLNFQTSRFRIFRPPPLKNRKNTPSQSRLAPWFFGKVMSLDPPHFSIYQGKSQPLRSYDYIQHGRFRIFRLTPLQACPACPHRLLRAQRRERKNMKTTFLIHYCHPSPRAGRRGGGRRSGREASGRKSVKNAVYIFFLPRLSARKRRCAHVDIRTGRPQPPPRRGTEERPRGEWREKCERLRLHIFPPAPLCP